MTLARVFCITVALSAGSASAQAIVESHPGFTAGIGAAGDVDRDGFADFLLPGGGRTHVLSGRDGGLLVSVAGTHRLPVVPLDEDVDGDGVADLLLGDDDAEIRSGRTGVLLRSHAATQQNGLGGGLNGVGDIDGDGVRDYGVVFNEVPQGCTPCPGSFEVALFSGVDGSDIRRWSVPGDYTYTYHVKGLGDIDLDGRNDYVVYSAVPGVLGGVAANYYSGATHARIPRSGWLPTLDLVPLVADVDGDAAADYIALFFSARNPHSASLISGRTEQVLATWTGDFTAMVPIGDADGDGTVDVGFGVGLAGLGSVVAWSLARQTTIWSLGELGSVDDLVALGDRDGDGRRELACGRFGLDAVVVDPSGIGDFSGSRASASLLQGATQSLSLSAPATHAGKAYWILGSLSGTAPGVALAGASIPLNPDSYTWITAGGPGLLRGGTGVLNAQGAAAATLTVPPLPAIARGVSMHHAYVVLGTGTLDYTSRPVPLALLP